ncbi:hypothetical protein [Paeniglutamicibacter gangotriensis]|uniref:Uncharacterized protein n=1 Tax=Paeniglutamicibacter gangotriensis Lz1y TaxID=1276920 RepID=M7N9A6_9MICC|nr:hypothetical protein [Paeniglutamicibacter gangotriensis]EMQ98364.1 hypothetical protein ADIAG_02383 [Paeniglutamicibacter gangotriensis Lz1y]
MTTPPLDLTAHDLAAIRIIAEGTSRGDTMRIKNTAVLRLLDRLEAAERDLAAVTVSRDGWQTRAEAAEAALQRVTREVDHWLDGGEEDKYHADQIVLALNHTPETETTP